MWLSVYQFLCATLSSLYPFKELHKLHTNAMRACTNENGKKRHHYLRTLAAAFRATSINEQKKYSFTKKFRGKREVVPEYNWVETELRSLRQPQLLKIYRSFRDSATTSHNSLIPKIACYCSTGVAWYCGILALTWAKGEAWFWCRPNTPKSEQSITTTTYSCYASQAVSPKPANNYATKQQ